LKRDQTERWQEIVVDIIDREEQGFIKLMDKCLVHVGISKQEFADSHTHYMGMPKTADEMHKL
jgi:hypothetical protein